MSAIIDQSVAISKELDYKQVKFSHPTYQFSRILPLSGSRSLTLTGGGNQEVLFEIPTKAINFAQSLMTWTTTVPSQSAASNRYSWVPMDTFGEINQIELYSRSGQFLARIEDCHNYLRVIRPKETPLQEFLSNEEKEGLAPCNSAANVNYLPVASQGAVTNASRAFTEQLYLQVSGADTAQTLYRQCRLSFLLNTIFSLDKTLLFPEVLVLRVIFNSTKLGWYGTSNTNPTTGAAALVTTQADITVADLQLLLAVDQSQEVYNSLAEKVKSGFNMMIPFVYRYKNNLSSDSQSVSIRLNRAHGAVCKKIIHSMFANVEAASNTMFDHSNIGANASTALKVTEYYTMLDNSRIQQFNLRATLNNGEDYIYHKKMLKGSVLQNQEIYSYNWFHCDSFENQIAPLDNLPVDKDNLITGIDLSIERKWDFVGQTTINATHNHYTFVCVEKALSISPSMITVV